MISDEDFARLRLVRSARIGPVTYKQLIGRFGSARAAIDALPELAKRGGARGVKLANEGTVEREIAATMKIGADFVFLGNADYPALLAYSDMAPAVLVTRGDRSIWDNPSVAMVGARNASAAACKLARTFALDLADRGVAVVSGLARGIDTAAHRGAIDGQTIAVIAGGIDNVYPPENRDLQEEIADRALLISEMPFGTEPRARHFPHRNRIIAALSQGTVVVEAAPRSGSLITARLAAEAGREVMAVPGSPLDPRSRGCNGLIRDGATLVQSADDIIEMLSGWDGPTQADVDRLELRDGEPGHFQAEGAILAWPDETPIVDAAETDRDTLTQLLSANYVSIDELVRQSEISVETVQLCLLELELAGKLERGAGAKVRLSG